MSILLRSSSSTGSLGGLFLCSALGLTLSACSGGTSRDPLDDPFDDREGAEMMAPEAPDTAAAGDDEPSVTDEGPPDVVGLDDGTLDGDSMSDPGIDDPDIEAGNMSLLPESELEVPATDHCAAATDWDPEWIQFEEEVFQLVNEMRSQPADCGAEGLFQPVAPVSMDPVLRCSARLHSLDMYERDYFDHFDPDGVAPVERMIAAGFEGRLSGENIAQGQRTPEEVMLAWMESDGHCANIMRAEYTSIGVGYAPGAPPRQGKSNFWTQNFGGLLGGGRARR